MDFGWRLFNKANVRFLLVLGFVISTLALVPFDSQGASPTPSLEISAPAKVGVDEAINIKLTVHNAADIAGFETNVLFDTSVAEFDGLHIRDNRMKNVGRDMGSLIVPLDGRGQAVGFYSCPFASCNAGKSARVSRGASGNVYLATVLVLGNQAGQLEIKFDELRFVDANGNPLTLGVPKSSVLIQVGSGGPRYPAPSAGYALSSANPTTTGPLNLTGRKTVSQADVSEAALAWKRSRLAGSPCANPDYAGFDVNHDGCVDIGDVERVAANYTPIARVAAAQATWTVNSVGDSPDSNPGDGICRTSFGYCTLRAAIQEADLNNGPSTIIFSIPGSGLQTIVLTGNEPTINNPAGSITIDGYTQPGAKPNTDPAADNAVIKIQIKGNGAGVSGYTALSVTSAGNLIRGLAIFNVLSAIELTGTGATNNTLAGNFIGTNAAGTWGFVNNRSGSGIHIDTGSSSNQIGNTALADRNLIAGNPGSGIDLEYDYCNYNVIYNNVIGLNPSGTKALPNDKHAVDINSSCSFNTVGGLQAGQRNVASGNMYSGINISHDGLTTENKVIGNYVGTDVSGNGAGDPTFCGTFYTGNQRSGIYVEDGVNNNLISNNVVGNNIGGGISNQKPNTVSNVYTNNLVGIGVNGKPIPNCVFGFFIGWSASNNRIGPGNTIAYNQEGVQTNSSAAFYNTITANSIYSNTNYQNPTPGNGRGIDNDPIDPNDPNALDNEAHWNDYSNHDLNWPVLTRATPYQVTGTACTASIVPQPCTIEVFIAAPALPNFGQGQTFVGSGQTDGTGNFTVFISGVQVGQYLTATATDAQGDTSEFGQNIQVVSGNPVPSPTPSLTPTPGPITTYASDSFARQISNGWGAADIGGGYSLNTALGFNESDFNVNGIAGTMAITTTQIWHQAFLPAVLAQDVDVIFKVSTDQIDSNCYQFIWFLVRRVNLGYGYMGRLDFDPRGGVDLQAAKNLGDNLTMLGNEAQVPGLAHTAGAFYWVHGRITGVNPTTISLRAWQDGNPEPSKWMYTVTDSEPVLQGPGAVGLENYLSTGCTSLPLTVSYESFKVTGPSGNGPTPTPTVYQSPTSTPTMTLTPSQTPIPSSTPTSTSTSTPTATPTISTYDADTFGRNLSNGWGNADIGGPYTYYGSTSDFAVNGSAGTMNLGAPGAIRSAYLMNVSAQDIEGVFRFQTNKGPAGGGQLTYFVARRVSDGNDYITRVRFPPGGGVGIQAAKEVGGNFTLFGSEYFLPGVNFLPNTYYDMRSQVLGTNPTTIKIRGWVDGNPEPTTWQYVAQDSEPILQAPGGVGLRAYLGATATNAPVLLSFSNLMVTNPISQGRPRGPVILSQGIPSPGEAEPLMTPTP